MDIETTTQWLDTQEVKAREHFENAIDHWIKFVEIALEIQTSGAWKQRAKTWAEYVRQTWDIDASRIRQYKAVLPYAQGIQELATDLSTPESALRKLKQVVDADDPRMATVYRLGKEASDELGEAIQTSFYEHALNVLEDEETAGGFVEIANGLQVPGDFEDMRKMAVLYQIDEARKRQRQHIREKQQRLPFTITARRIADNTYQLVIPDDLPLQDEFEFTFWQTVKPEDESAENVS